MADAFELRPDEAALAGVELRDGVLHLGSPAVQPAALAVVAALVGLLGTVVVGVLAGLGLFGGGDGGDPSLGAWAVQLLWLVTVGGWWWRATRLGVAADAHGITVPRALGRTVHVAHRDLAAVRVARRAGGAGEPPWEVPELVRADGTVVVCRPLAGRAAEPAPGPAAARAALLERFHLAQPR